jgi:fucose 4-O-acetylase-like acetyltransferase
MPLFFFCSGIFYKEMLSKGSVTIFLKKRVRGLYFPFVKWSVLFLLLHNLLLAIGVYNSHYGYEGGSFYYSVSDVIRRLGLILFTMTGYEELLGGFWFIRSLFVSCLLIAFISFILRFSFKYKHELICFFFLIMTIFLRRYVPDVEFPREVSMGSFGAMFYMLGYLLSSYPRFWQNKYGAVTCCLFLFIFLYYFRSGVSMGCGYNKVIPFSLSAISGTLLTIYVSKLIEKRIPIIKRTLYYIGNHTLEILSLHFISFRFVSFLFTMIYGIDVIHIAEHPVIKNINITHSYWWLIYAIAGIVIPLLLDKVWQIVIYKIKR